MAASFAKQGSEMSTFSYAQAAKGLSSGPSAQQNKAATSSASSASGGQKKSAASEAETPESASTDAQQSSVNGVKDVLSKQSQSTEESANKAESAAPPATATHSLDAVTTSTADAATLLPKEDDPSSTPNGTSDSTWDKQSQVSSTVDRSSQTTEASKDKQPDGENGWEKNPPAAKELKAAPIPTVNVWQQRREAQEAKAKAMSALSPPPAAAMTSKATSAKPATSDGRGTNNGPKITSSREPSGASGNANGTSSKDKRKQTAGPKSKDDAVVAPADDTVSWPTPQSAQDEGQKKSQDKSQQSDKPSDKEKPSKHGKEKWMPVPYVPSAVFNTPLPPAARRSGRPARGGREGGSQVANAGEKSTSAPPTTATGSKKSHAPDRGHHGDRGATEDGKGARQDSSAPKAADNARPEQRKNNNTHVPNSDHAHNHNKDTKFGKNKERNQSHADDNRPPHAHAPANSFQPRQEFKSFSKTHDFPAMRFHADNNTHGYSRYAMDNNHDRRFESGPRSADFYKERNGFGQQGRDRDYQRSDNHRERGDSRSERGGRGAYRSRGGGHSNFNGPQNPPYHSAPISQQPFPPKAFTLNDRHRPHHTGPNARVNIRSPSMSAASMYGPGPYPIQTDMSAFYGYPHIPQSPMTAFHYQPYMEQVSLMSMISMQLEYYFSVDNLCKDLYLRKHMDSQGFVLLSVIANFKRIKSLTEDMDLLRYVCRQLKNVEYRPGENGTDRLRKREKWEQWVLNMNMRDSSAQNDGPGPINHATPLSPDGRTTHDGVMQPVQHADGAIPNTNGVSHGNSASAAPHQFPLSDVTNMDSHPRPAKLSSTAPEFLPLGPPPTQYENANVRKSVDQSPFPDDQIENLVIVVRKPGVSSPAHSPFLLPSSRSFSFGSVDGYKAAGGTVTPEDHQSSFASPEVRSLSEKFNNVERPQNTKRTLPAELPESVGRPVSTFWVKAKDTPIESLPTDLVHESYAAFHKRTLEKRQAMSSEDHLLDMDVLYQFWSHFLVQNFNTKMYNEFKSLAFDDFYVRNSGTGLKNLTKFYDEALSNDSVLPDGVARDLVDLAHTELNEKEKPVFRKLRSAWRNGAFNLKSRRKIDCILDESLRAELEK